jgi:type I restriction enzyme R subunit
MTEFEQIVGRGTRVHANSQKCYFTLVDFRKASNHFADPAFDGEPVQIYEPGEGDDPLPPEEAGPQQRTVTSSGRMTRRTAREKHC